MAWDPIILRDPPPVRRFSIGDGFATHRSAFAARALQSSPNLGAGQVEISPGDELARIRAEFSLVRSQFAS
jgi:hypothetical protein